MATISILLANKVIFKKLNDYGLTRGEIVWDLCHHAGIPQDRILRPIVYSIFTVDLLVREDTTRCTFAEDTAVLTSDKNGNKTTDKLQNHLNDIENLMVNWRIKVNVDKLSNILFTTKRSNCPLVLLTNKVIPPKMW